MLPEQVVVVVALAVVTLFRLLHQHHESIDSLATLCKIDLKFGAHSVAIGGWRWRKCPTVEKYWRLSHWFRGYMVRFPRKAKTPLDRGVEKIVRWQFRDRQDGARGLSSGVFAFRGNRTTYHGVQIRV
ncbi:hypothetical protein TSUD_297160 [Trifolium subterraneum]|uniref:Secreted protein n=1 Tax=Trifolium subterraneum TaxID=3900 RepID=A0A2Z6NVQ7_TRISU|nr:hypothetical protein TSUD_297160 [Trifolium subterraneum]